MGTWDTNARVNTAHLSHPSQLSQPKRLSLECGGRIGEPAKYIRSDVPAETKPFHDMTMVEAAHQVLGDQRLTTTELAVAMLEAGYETAMCNKTFRDAWARSLLRPHAGRPRDAGLPVLWVVGCDETVCSC